MPQQFDFPKNPLQQLRFNPRTVYLVLAVLATLWVLSGIYTVAPDEKAVILRFGKLHDVVDPGLHYHLPRPIEMNIIRSTTRVYREEIGFQTIDPGPPARYRQRPKESLMLTGERRRCERMNELKHNGASAGEHHQSNAMIRLKYDSILINYCFRER
ncbi:MAG TPA: hypothetical protein EYQ31_14935, partial [Candidatus Handelsmanbacteria bacterium]|nr:hypothetical protein [Candidatus Handelsmanbacteria bacterium]